MAAAAPPSSVMNSRLLIIRSPGRHGRALAANFELQRLRCLKVDGWELRRLAGPMVSELISDQCARASRQIVLELLAEVPIAASLGGIRPIPAQVDRRRRRHSRGGHDGAQCDTVKDGPVVGLRDPGPDGPHDRGRFHGYSAAPAHCDMGPAGCDASMSKSDVPGSDHDTSMPACDVTGSGDASMPNRDVPGSDGGTLMSNYGVTGHRDTFT